MRYKSEMERQIAFVSQTCVKLLSVLIENEYVFMKVSPTLIRPRTIYARLTIFCNFVFSRLVIDVIF
jgi:hypothetical protein